MSLQAFDNWGFHMRKYYGKSTKMRDTDFTINYLSYWSDNGETRRFMFSTKHRNALR